MCLVYHVVLVSLTPFQRSITRRGSIELMMTSMPVGRPRHPQTRKSNILCFGVVIIGAVRGGALHDGRRQHGVEGGV